MSKFSVKKPFTVLVMVVIILVLGFVSLSRMQMDLLPQISLPYIMVITSYPGASPEKVETAVCEPMESALGTISGVKNIYSVSNENYGMVQLEFEDGTDMDSAMVKISSSLDMIKDYLPDDVGTPSILEISMDMMASEYLALSYEGMEIEELSDFARKDVIPMFERIDGVASVSDIGIVDKSLQIELDSAKVDDLNNKILAKTDDAFAEALEKLDDAKKQLEESEDKLKDSKQELVNAQNELEDGKQELVDAQTELDNSRKELEDGKNEIANSKAQLENGKTELENQKTEAERKLAETELQLLTAKSDLEAAKTHIGTEISMLQGTMTAYSENVGKIGQAITGLDGLAAGLNGVIGGINEFVALGVAPEVTAVSLQSSLNTVNDNIAKMNPYLTAMGQAEVQIIPAETINALLSGSGTGISITGDSSIADILSAIDTAKIAYNYTKSQLEAQIAGNNQALASYQASLIQIDEGMKQVDEGFTQLYAGNLEAAIQIANANTQLVVGELQINTAQAQLEAGETQLEEAQKQIDSGWDSLEDGQKKIDDGWDQLKDGQKQIDDGWEQYNDSVESFEKQKAETLRHANADDLLKLETLAQIIYAQNFEMPAGYIDDKDDNSWLLKVGESYDSIDDIKNMVLCHIDDIGDVKLGDVAQITVIDNSMDSYARLNGDKAVILSIFKGSTVGTNALSRSCSELIKNLENKYNGLKIMVIMDQGDYINIILKSLAQSMLLGALLAVIILAVFLKDFKPTLVVALSIPLSVLTALVALYFAGISLNMMTLSGLSLGIGMLVDNSIVVMENIYRLRNRGVEAARASVQGAKQVTGAIIASTLTTVCVFFPMIYTTGLVNELMVPMALSIIFCLGASLLVSLTLVPATCSTLLKKSAIKDHKFFDKIQDAYGKVLDYCLKVKLVPILISVLLLAISIWQILRMGIVMIPEMTSNEMQMNISMADEMERDECYELADLALEKIVGIEGVGSVGVMSGGEASIMASSANLDANFREYSYMIVMEDENAGRTEVKRVISEIENQMTMLNLEAKGCEYSVSSSMMDTSQLLGNGLSINIYGDDTAELVRISQDIMSKVGSIEGFTEISNGQETPDQVIKLDIDKNKAMGLGLSVAQIFAGITDKLETEVSSVSVDIAGENMNVVVVSNIDALTYENLMDFEFEVNKTDEDGTNYTEDVKLSEFASKQFEDGVESIRRENQSRYITVSAGVEEGYNTTLLTRELEPIIEKYQLPEGYKIEISGEYDTVNTMIKDMILVIALGALLIYLVMVAQFQSLLSPFIVIFTIPLAFTGGLIGLWISGENLSIMGLMGFVLLLGTVVNNGIVFVDYVNQLRKAGLDRHTALIATGKTRMRPILMTAFTTILAMSALIFGDDMGSQMGKGMAIVVASGLLYATLMTLFIIPVMYDILYKKQPLDVDLGSEDLDDVPDDAAEYVLEMEAKEN